MIDVLISMRVYILTIVQKLYSGNSINWCTITIQLCVLLQGVSEPLHGPPPDPAGLGEQGQDQWSVHDEVEQEKEQAEEPSSDGC